MKGFLIFLEHLTIVKNKKMVKEIKVLGSGCPSCIKLENNVKLALEKSGKEIKITKITDIVKIVEYGVMSTPALVFDEEVVSYGKVNDVGEIVELLNKYSCLDKKNCSSASSSKDNKKTCCK